ncbi:MAG: trypsin-like peptidase domain-containing protein, partial [Phycisphaerae bacterium]
MKFLKYIVVAVLGCGVMAYFLTPPLVQRLAYAAAKGQAEAGREQLAQLAQQDRLSPLFVEVAKVLKPAVVEVRVTKRMRTDMMPDIEQYFERFFGDQGPMRFHRGPSMSPREYLQRGLGSGVIVDAQNGYVLTNYHVVASTDETQVVLADGRTFKAQWVRNDPLSDLSIIKIDAKDLIAAPLGDSDKVS